jgi:hypothetical protein
MKNVTVKSSIIVAALLAVGFSGCAEKKACDTQTITKKASSANAGANANGNAKSDAEIAKLRAELAAAKKAPAKVVTKTVSGPNELYPPNAQPGKCYARVLIPAKYEVKTEKVLVSGGGIGGGVTGADASAGTANERIVVTPAKYGYKSQKVLVKEASEKIVVVPATYKTIKEKVEVSPASERLVTVPAKYKSVTEKILVAPEMTTWKKGNRSRTNKCSTGDCDNVKGGTGEVMCLVTTPAQYRTVTRKAIVQPASTKSTPVPAVYKTITKRVVDRPASTKTVPLPAQYKTIKVKTIVQPATTKRVAIPPVYKTITKKVKVADAKLTWKEVKCKSVRY